MAGTKCLRYYKGEDNYCVVSDFVLGKGASEWNDAVFNTFSAIVASITLDAEYVTEKKLILPLDVDWDRFLSVLHKCGFHIDNNLQPPKEELEMEIIKSKVKKRIAPKRLDIPQAVLAMDLKEYVQGGVTMKLVERLVEGDTSSPTVETAVKRVFETIPLKTADKTIAISMKSFCSTLEMSNKVLINLHAEFKGKSRIEFLEKRREGQILEAYRQVFGGIDTDLKVGDIIKGWRIVDASRVYELIYKFGTQHKKTYFPIGKHLILKPFRSDFVVILRRDYLFSLPNNEVINFSLRRVP